MLFSDLLCRPLCLLLSFLFWPLVPLALAPCFLFLPPSGVGFFLFLSPFLLRPRCLWLALVSGPGCPGPSRCVLFVLLGFRFPALCALSPCLCLLPGLLLLPGGCRPPPPSPVVSRDFRRRRSVPCFFLFFFRSFPFLCPRCLRLFLVSGPGRRGPWRCVLFVLFASCFPAQESVETVMWCR